MGAHIGLGAGLGLGVGLGAGTCVLCTSVDRGVDISFRLQFYRLPANWLQAIGYRLWPLGVLTTLDLPSSVPAPRARWLYLERKGRQTNQEYLSEELLTWCRVRLSDKSFCKLSCCFYFNVEIQNNNSILQALLSFIGAPARHEPCARLRGGEHGGRL